MRITRIGSDKDLDNETIIVRKRILGELLMKGDQNSVWGYRVRKYIAPKTENFNTEVIAVVCSLNK